MNTYTLLRHVSLYPDIRRYRSKKDIGPLGWGETAVRLDFRLWGIWWAVKSTSGIKLVDGSQMPVHVMHSLDGKVIMGQRDIEAAKGTAYAEAWRESIRSDSTTSEARPATNQLLAGAKRMPRPNRSRSSC